MKFYFLYIATSLLTAWVILVLLGVSAGFANFIPVIALIGSLLLFAIATPVMLYYNRLGVILGLIFLLMIIPYSVGFAKSGLEDRVFNWGVVLTFLPLFLAILAVYLSVKYIFFQPSISLSLPTSFIAKLLLSAIPIATTLLYFIFYGKEWF